MLFRLGLIAFNIWSAKKSFDLLKTNTELKQQLSDSNATVRNLASQVGQDLYSPGPLSETGPEITVEEVKTL